MNMTMLFYVLVLCLTSWSVEATKRSDYVSSITPSTHTSWGSWGHEDWCSEGSYAYGFRLKVERLQGTSVDDTALNGIELLCRTYCMADTHVIASLKGGWGGWTNVKKCTAEYLLNGAQARSEPRISGDNTAGDGMSWGSWTTRRDCPSGSYICGIRTRVEAPQGSSVDDTALNGAIFYCCQLKATQCGKRSFIK